MNFKIFSIVFLAAYSFHRPLHAAFELKTAGASSASLGGAANSSSAGAQAAFHNPASLRLQGNLELFSFYSRFYSLKELSYLGSAAALPLPAGVFGFAYSQLGERVYQEKEAAVSYAFGLTPRVFLGASSRGYFLKIDDFGSATALGLDVGVTSLISSRARLSIAGKNLNRPKIGRSQISLPTGIMAGGAAELIEGLRLIAEVQAAEPDPVTFKSGLEFFLADKFFLRGGVQSASVQFSGGFGAKFHGIKFDYSYVHHLRLPGTHQVSVGLEWDRSGARKNLSEAVPVSE